MIICSKCKNEKHENDFYGRGDGSGKKKNRCKQCDNATKHNYYVQNSEKIRRKTKKWYNANKSKRKAVTRLYLKTPKGRLVKLMRGAKTRAKKYKHSFDLNAGFLLELWHKQNGKCALTNIKFEFENTTRYGANPYSPSIDRIDSSRGYEKDNVRFVCVAVNYALNEFGEETFKRICWAYLKQFNDPESIAIIREYPITNS